MMKRKTIAAVAALALTTSTLSAQQTATEAARTNAAKATTSPILNADGPVGRVTDGINRVENRVGNAIRGTANAINPNGAVQNGTVQATGPTYYVGGDGLLRDANGRFLLGSDGQPVRYEQSNNQNQADSQNQGTAQNGKAIPAGQQSQNAKNSQNAQQTKQAQNQQNSGQSRAQNGTPLREALVQKLKMANDAEIKLAKMAQKRLKNEQAKEFAKTLQSEHEGLNADLEKMKLKSGSDANSQSVVYVPNAVCDLQKQTCERTLEMTMKMLEEYQGNDFEMAFIGQQIVCHTGMLAELRTLEQSGPEGLRDYASNAAGKVEKHLNKAKDLAKQLEKQENKS